MNDIHQRLAALGLIVPEVLIPGAGVDISKWAVIACDQFTQDRAYWETVQKAVGDDPSALRLIFPEVYLEDDDKLQRIEIIRQSMEDYLANGIFAPPQQALVYLERDTSLHQKRRGLIAALDLEQYDWSPAARPLIRATEGTVPERLPPRMDIRRGAPLETPHILVLIDDDTDSLLSALGENAKRSRPVYQSPLMMNSGAVSGWILPDAETWAALAESLENLGRKANARYGVTDTVPFLYAVGDGNHSLATARAIWEEYKKAHSGEPELDQHPCRYAMVEIENLYDPAIQFEPIHRVLFGTDSSAVEGILKQLNGFRYSKKSERYFALQADTAELATVSLQPLLDELVKSTGAVIDYIHGKGELSRLAANKAKPAICIELPPIKKSGLFETVAQSGPLPRKSFSMGEAAEKRFYLECRRLFG
ncbi:MAG: DUF1015 domain-containing protein [Treponema sp.]|jgi:hypothetical protein|nr:DUF1015 domain-containing protein [Treponema sp.]